MKLSSITAESLVRIIRKRNLRYGIGAIFFVLLSCLLLMVACDMIRNQSYGYGLLGILVSVICIDQSFTAAVTRLSVVSDTDHCRFFRKFGSPEQIAAQMTDEAERILFQHKSIILTQSYIINTNDLETFLPYDQIRLLYRETHRTNGVADGTYLVLHDAFNDIHKYAFPIGKKKAAIQNEAASLIIERAPNVLIGYTNDNLQQVEANKQTL